MISADAFIYWWSRGDISSLDSTPSYHHQVESRNLPHSCYILHICVPWTGKCFVSFISCSQRCVIGTQTSYLIGVITLPHKRKWVDRKRSTYYVGFHAISGNLFRDFPHYDDVIMGAMPSQITSLTFRRRSKKTSKIRVIGLYAVAGKFPAQMASNAENVEDIWT